MVLEKGTRIKSIFNADDYGTIESYQQANGILAEGYFVKFDDYPTALFMSIHAISELYNVIEEE